jgi:hypothetical protein
MSTRVFYTLPIWYRIEIIDVYSILLLIRKQKIA